MLLLLLFSCQAVSDSLQPCGLQQARLPCPFPFPRVCPSSCPLNQWCHPTISSSIALFSFCLPSFPASGSFPLSQLFVSDDQSIGASASASVLPIIFRGDFLLDWLVGFPCSPRDSQKSCPGPEFKSINSLALWLLYGPVLTSIRDYWKDHNLNYMDLFNILSRFVIAFLPRSNHLQISWLQSPPEVIFGPKKRKSVTAPPFSPSICCEMMGPDDMILVFLIPILTMLTSLQKSVTSVLSQRARLWLFSHYTLNVH